MRATSALEKDFFAYDVVNASDESSGDHPERLLAFGGKGYNFAAAERQNL